MNGNHLRETMCDCGQGIRDWSLHDENCAYVKWLRKKPTNEYMTVGALRRALSDYHDSDLVAVVIDNLMHKVKVDESRTAFGFAVTIKPGDRYV